MLGAARCARALGAARHSAAARGALAPRRALQGGPRAPKMQPHDVVQEWFDDGTLIVPSLNIFCTYPKYESLSLINLKSLINCVCYLTELLGLATFGTEEEQKYLPIFISKS